MVWVAAPRIALKVLLLNLPSSSSPLFCMIGLMRGGYFLAEESPEKLLRQFGVETLEDVFLKLSLLQNSDRQSRSSTSRKETGSIVTSANAVNESEVLDDVDAGDSGEISGEFGDNISLNSQGGRKHSLVPSRGNEIESAPLPEPPPKEDRPAKISDYLLNLKSHHMKALIWKNCLWMLRNVPVMLLVNALPIIQVSLFCTAIGREPRNLTVAVVNYEANSTNCEQELMCNTTYLSCNYLGYLHRRGLDLVQYDTEDHARESVMKGKTYASVVVRQNYSKALRARIRNWRFSRPVDIEASEIDVVRDLTSKDIATFLKVYLYTTFQNYIQDFLQSCNISRKLIDIPIRLEEPVYGLKYPNFTDFAAPGIVLTIIFFLALALTAGAMLIERNEGILERSLIIGISPTELLIAHVICQFFVMAFQTCSVITCIFAIFKMTLNGSVTLVILLTLLAGFCGMCFGFIVSCACDTERTATYLALGSFLPMILLCGIIWPIEAMHPVLQMSSNFLPLTKATESMRSVLQRGWGFSNKVVYMGFISLTMWVIVFLIISIMILKFKKG